ncbi:MAG: site-specific integrase [Thermoanaerobaculia bacterium]|nr:site-specific integrase [Thermoanaerobaculia bacterium]
MGRPTCLGSCGNWSVPISWNGGASDGRSRRSSSRRGARRRLGRRGTRLFRRISRESGVWVHPHALRHTFVTLCALRGVPSRIIQVLAGHASLNMVERYSHVVSREARDAAERIALDVAFPGDETEGYAAWRDAPTGA